MARKEELMNVYRVLVRKETHIRPSGKWKIILISILQNIISDYVIRIFWLRIGACEGLLLIG